jgi:biotin transport system substrate-specific component
VGAVLLVGCLGGRNAALISQIAYLALGLVGFPIFGRGGGLSYWQEPTFGYLLGFIPGAWLCGYLAFKRPARLESLAFSCVCGLVSIHLVGLVYLTLGHLFHWWADPVTTSLWSEIRKYSVNPLPGQLIVVCVATVLGYLLRYLMFY